MPGHRQKEFEAASFALDQIRHQPDGDKREAIIRMYFWKKTMTIAGAGMRVGFAERTARRICWQYVLAIGKGMGYISTDEYREALGNDN